MKRYHSKIDSPCILYEFISDDEGIFDISPYGEFVEEFYEPFEDIISPDLEWPRVISIF